MAFVMQDICAHKTHAGASFTVQQAIALRLDFFGVKQFNDGINTLKTANLLIRLFKRILNGLICCAHRAFNPIGHERFAYRNDYQNDCDCGNCRADYNCIIIRPKQDQDSRWIRRPLSNSARQHRGFFRAGHLLANRDCRNRFHRRCMARFAARSSETDRPEKNTAPKIGGG